MNPITRQSPVALLGLGPMGMPMAKNLLASWGAITIWNRTAAKAEELRTWGATIATSPREAAREITLTVLPGLVAVESLLGGPDGLLAGWAERQIISPILVVHGAGSPIGMTEFASTMMSRHRVQVINAALRGGIAEARHATLHIASSGDEATARSLDLLFSRLGRPASYHGKLESDTRADPRTMITNSQDRARTLGRFVFPHTLAQVARA